MIQFDCPHCGQALKVKDDAAGRRGKCKFCTESINVPTRTPSPPGQTLTAVESPSAPIEVQIDTHGPASQTPTELVPIEGQTPTAQPEKQHGGLRSLIHKFTTDEQDPKVVERVQERIQKILMSKEELLYIAVQNKPVVNISPDCIVLTDKRFIIYQPTVIGRVSFEDYVWRELRDAKLHEGIMGATISVMTASDKKLSIDYLPKPQARQVYRIAQEQEERALEERRQRKIEESRAAAGGVVVQSAYGTPTTPHAQNSAQQEDPVAILQKLKEMLDADLINSDEYETKKAEILSRM